MRVPGYWIMIELIKYIEKLTDTRELEDLLIASAYWVGIIIMVIFVFWMTVKINNYIQSRKSERAKDDRDDYMV